MGDQEMHVVKRDGSMQDVSFDKILHRVKALGNECDPPLNINYAELVMRVIDQLYSGVTTGAIDELTAEQCASLCTQHPDYGVLAGRIVVSNCQKNTSPSFLDTITKLRDYKDVNGDPAPLVSDTIATLAHQHRDDIESMIQYDRDFLIDYFMNRSGTHRA